MNEDTLSVKTTVWSCVHANDFNNVYEDNKFWPFKRLGLLTDRQTERLTDLTDR